MPGGRPSNARPSLTGGGYAAVGHTHTLTDLSDVTGKTGTGSTVVLSDSPMLTGTVMASRVQLSDELTVEGFTFLNNGAAVALSFVVEGVTQLNDDLTVNSLTFLNDEVLISGPLTATSTLKLTAGVPASGKVLTSDAVGLATWQTSAAGVTDHGALTGLADDDHEQYALVDGNRSANIGARVSHSVFVSIGTATWTAIPFDTELYDLGDLHSVTVNNTRMIISVNGVYAITGGVHWDSSSSGQRIIRLLVNGTTDLAQENGVGGNAQRITITSLYKLSKDDYVELQVWQNSGATLKVLPMGIRSPYLAIQKVG